MRREAAKGDEKPPLIHHKTTTMYKKNKPTQTDLLVNKSYTGETIEQKVDRIMNNKEPITDGADLIYTDRKDGVLPAYNIRTDRMEHALDAMDYVTKSHIAKREEKAKAAGTETKDSATTSTMEGGQGGQSTAGTDSK